ncbi:acetyltransferase [Verticillium dahliae]|nr:Chaperone protein dnaK [Verticillium dahliae VDG2]
MVNPTTTLLWDHLEYLPLANHLAEEDLILLLTPVIEPPGETPPSQDPFEPLGRAIATQHPLVRHVPYTKNGGITDAHKVFIERCKAIIFVITGPPSAKGPSQASLAATAFRIGDDRPQIILACCDFCAHNLQAESFPTVIQATSLSPPSLIEAASFLFRSHASLSPPQALPKVPIQFWSPNRDLPAITSLWRACLPACFHLPQHVLAPLLRRDGYAMHLTVRDPHSDALIAFCATYTTYPSTLTSNLLGSLALLLVHPDHRRRGIGTALHDVALAQLRRTPGVEALLLGSAFPRLLAGVPIDAGSKDWFAERGWRDSGPASEVSDWTVSFDGAPPHSSPVVPGLDFRPCDEGDLGRVVAFAEQGDGGIRQGKRSGYGEQFSRLEGTTHVEDVMVGYQGRDVVAAAVLYVPRDGSPAAGDVPWARTLGEDVGGLTCVCVTSEKGRSSPVSASHPTTRRKSADGPPEATSGVDTVLLVSLMGACMDRLAQRGMKHMYVDGLRGGDESMQKLGKSPSPLSFLSSLMADGGN